ncbi:MAG: AraC family transcriptional regulator [Lachnospiraceae bacterium]|nr:AraC family transcriptional regulator [Lachnospiraceae bacterium]
MTESESPESFPAHWHDAAEFTICLKSSCTYRINGTLYELKEGDVLLTWPQQVHETIKAPRGGVIFIQFSSTIIEGNLDLVSISRFLYEYRHISNTKNPELAGFIRDKIYEIKRIHNESDPLEETRCKIIIYDILLKIGEHVIKEFLGDYDLKKSASTSLKYIHSACNYIIENSHDSITQAEVAEYVGLSSYYFSKLFKQFMHISFPAYLSNIRVKNACNLLLNDNLSITECAFMSGFQSTTAFNKAFHDVTGYSPRDFRKLYR